MELAAPAPRVATALSLNSWMRRLQNQCQWVGRLGYGPGILGTSASTCSRQSSARAPHFGSSCQRAWDQEEWEDAAAALALLCGGGAVLRGRGRRRAAGRGAGRHAGRAAEVPASGPSDMLRRWRRARRRQLAPAVARSWARTDSLPRGSDAGFAFENVGPLVGCPPSLWVYFVGGREGSGDDASGAARDALRLFEKACDTMLSYTLLTSSAGYLADPLAAEEQREDGEEGLHAAEAFNASHVFARYDVVVALDEQTRERVAALAGNGSSESCRLCCLTDFLDVCEESVQLEQLDRLLGPATLATAGSRGGALMRPSSSSAHQALRQARTLTDLPSSGGGGLADRAARALGAAGLERFLIEQFPTHMKDRLHPYLVPKGL